MRQQIDSHLGCQHISPPHSYEANHGIEQIGWGIHQNQFNCKIQTYSIKILWYVSTPVCQYIYKTDQILYIAFYQNKSSITNHGWKVRYVFHDWSFKIKKFYVEYNFHSLMAKTIETHIVYLVYLITCAHRFVLLLWLCNDHYWVSMTYLFPQSDCFTYIGAIIIIVIDIYSIQREDKRRIHAQRLCRVVIKVCMKHINHSTSA